VNDCQRAKRLSRENKREKQHTQSPVPQLSRFEHFGEACFHGESVLEARNAIKLLQTGIDALKITARRVAYSLTNGERPLSISG